MKIILASKSGVRKQILNKYNIECEVCPSNVNEDEVKKCSVYQSYTKTYFKKPC